MAKRELKATIGLAAIALALGSCGLSAGDAIDGPYARLGPHEAPDLAKTHQFIAVDLKGFGQSDKPFDSRYSVFDQAELLAQLIVDKDLRDLTIVGHSFGGGI